MTAEEERWVGVEDVAAHLDVNKDSVYRWIDKIGLPADILTSVNTNMSSLTKLHFGSHSLQPYGLRPIVSLSYT